MKKVFPYLVVVLITLCIFSLSLQDAPTSNHLSMSITEKLLPQTAIEHPEKTFILNNFIREFAHILEFFILGFFSMFAFSFVQFSLTKSTLLTLIYTGSIAILDELIQFSFSPGRAFQFIDLLKDWLGVGLAILSFLLLYKICQLTYHNIRKIL